MKKPLNHSGNILKHCMLLSILPFQACLVFAANEPEILEVELSSPGEPATLIMETLNDQITVHAEERENIRFEITEIIEIENESESETIVDEDRGRVKYRLRQSFQIRTKTNRSELRDISSLQKLDKSPGYEMIERNNVLKMESLSRVFSAGKGRHIIVKVPINTSLRLESMQRKGLTINGAKGSHEFESNGPINATDISGSVVAESAFGDIVVTMLEVSPDNPLAFSSGMGDIDLTFPASFGADASIKLGLGSTYTDFDFELDDSPRIERLGGGKGTRIEFGGGLRGSLNGGGASLRIETFNGSVYIRKGS